jgi:hypothetical protein
MDCWRVEKGHCYALASWLWLQGHLHQHIVKAVDDGWSHQVCRTGDSDSAWLEWSVCVNCTSMHLHITGTYCYVLVCTERCWKVERRHIGDHTGTYLYIQVCTWMYQKPWFCSTGLDSRWQPVILSQYVLVCTGMYCLVLVPALYKVVHGGKGGTVTVEGHSGTWQYKQQYMAVWGGTWQYKNLLNHTYWYVLECTDPYGSIQVRVGFSAVFAAAILHCPKRCIGDQSPYPITQMQAQACCNQPSPA